MKPTAASARKALHALADPETAQFLQRFFKTAKGEYAEGDLFLGIRVPAVRAIVRDHQGLPLDEMIKLLRSRWHEERLLGLLLMVDAYKLGDFAERQAIHDAYLANTDRINNWDLVDASAEHVVGPHLAATRIGLLKRLARSPDLWERRIAIVATFAFIKKGELRPTMEIAALLVNDSHDLIHKAVGWMLREAGKRDQAAEEEFLRKHQSTMPRTMLRYAIERFPESLRRRYLAGIG